MKISALLTSAVALGLVVVSTGCDLTVPPPPTVMSTNLYRVVGVFGTNGVIVESPNTNLWGSFRVLRARSVESLVVGDTARVELQVFRRLNEGPYPTNVVAYKAVP